MKHINIRKTLNVAALIGASIVAASALADPPQGANGSGYGMGPGMMGGYGPGYGMGPGMMGGYGPGSGMGYGMMGGYGPGYGMSPGMINGFGPGSELNLSAEQRSKIAAIQNDIRRKHWELMGKMHEEQSHMQEQYLSDKQDDAVLSKRYRAMSELRHQMFDLSLGARKQIDAILTKEQRDKLKRSGYWMRGN